MSIRDRSRDRSHHASSESARQRRGTSSSVSTRRPASVTTLRSSSGSARRNGPGAAGSGRSMSPSSTCGPPGRGHPVVLVRGGPDRERRASSGLQHACDLGQGTRWLGDEHDPEAADDAVDRAVEKADRRGILHAELDVLDPELCGPAASGVDHLREPRRVESRSPFGPSRSAAMKPVSRGRPRARARCRPEQGRAARRVARPDGASPRGRVPPGAPSLQRPLARPRPARARVSLCGHLRELRDDVPPVGFEHLFLTLGHEVDVEVIDADRLELP